MFGLTPYRKNTVSGYNPFRELEELEKTFFGNPFAESEMTAFLGTDITDQGDSYLLEADLPGMKKEDIHLEINGDELTISAERKNEKKDDKNGYVRMERSYGTYRRTFDVSAIDTEKIAAKYDNGVLTLTLPKKEEVLPKARSIDIA